MLLTLMDILLSNLNCNDDIFGNFMEKTPILKLLDGTSHAIPKSISNIRVKNINVLNGLTITEKCLTLEYVIN